MCRVAPGTRALGMAMVLGVGACSEAGVADDGGTTPLRELAPNRWHKIQEERPGSPWRRQAHAGLAYDSKRNRLLIFGSDTHGNDWDNSVHEFDPVARRWITHAPPAAPETYRADEAGHAIAGTDRLQPWAMHTYDNIVYDPSLDALVVTALPEHNGAGKKRAPDAKVHPTWLYDLATRTWRIFANDGTPAPKFFAAASAYDERRDTVVAYRKWQLWELGPERRKWQLTSRTPQKFHEIHFSMVYDNRRGQLAIFGDYRNTNEVTIYTPGPTAGEPGVWERRTPGGDEVPLDQHLPVAFDRGNGVYLLVADNNRFTLNEWGKPRRAGADSASTFVYDPDRNRYRRLPDADLPPQRMNYMMAYDRTHQVFLLVTGRGSEPPAVLALRLDPGALR